MSAWKRPWIGLSLCVLSSILNAQEPLRAKVIAVFPDRNTTKMVVESNQPFVAGRSVYVGDDKIEVTLGDLLSRSESLYYYSASVPGKAKIQQGDIVNTEAPKTLSVPAKILSLNIKESYTFEQKRRGEVTAVQGGRAMIDRGTLHEVRERDIYRVYDASGAYKGMLEVRGTGDLQSSGKLYNTLGDWRRKALETRPGDRVVFAGQRKLFALGLLGGIRSSRETLLDTKENPYGVGLLWNVTFPDGWGLEVLFGGFVRDGKGRIAFKKGLGVDYINKDERLERQARFIAPIWIKKNLFYPSVVSPFAGAGFALFTGKNSYYRNTTQGLGQTEQIEENVSATAIVPMLGGGIEFFPGRFFRPRLEVRWLGGPKITAAGNTFYTESTFYSFGFLTTW